MNDALESPVTNTLFPVTAAQARLWSLARDYGDDVSKNIAVQWELRGRFSDDSVEKAFQAVFDRHEILRTAFVEHKGRLRQKVVADVPFRLGLIDIRSIPQSDSDDRIRAIAEELAAHPFDMASPGHLRACLVRFAPERAMLLIATHYGVFDGYSIRVLGREIGTLIAASETGRVAALPELALQYGDYAQWREACENSPAMIEARDYWHAKLREKPYFEIPTDRQRRVGTERTGKTLKLPMAANFRADLERAGKAQGTSPFAFGAGVMAAALHAVTGQRDVGFTTCVAGREEAELEDLIGVFVNPVVLQFDCAHATVGDLVSASRRIVAEALAHGDYPFDELANDLGQLVDPSKTPFVSPFFSLQSVFVEEQDYGPLRIISVPSHTPQVTHDLAVQIIGRDSGWHMIIDYDTGLFDEATVLSFGDVLQKAFATAFDSPGTAASALTVTPVAANTPSPIPEIALETGAHLAPQDIKQAPRSLIQLTAIWRESLGVTPHGADSDFFDLGGNSLAAVRMLTKVHTDLGARVSIADFFDNPTLGGLAGKIDVHLGWTAKTDVEDTFWNVISLGQAPKTAPLIVSVNQPFLYNGLARAIGPKAEVINLHIKDDDVLEGPDAEVLSSLVETAAQTVAALAAGRRLFMIGHCVDGTLSLLIARRLTDLGHTPELVSMIDCWAPDANAGMSQRQLRWRRRGAKARRWGQNFRQLSLGEIGWTEFLARNKLTRPMLERRGHVAPVTQVERVEWAVNARLLALVRTMSYAPYGGEVALFLTGGQYKDARPRVFGWAGRLPADTPIYDLAGWHEYALKQHGVKTISSILSCRLERGAT